jgi:hypothetical protein
LGELLLSPSKTKSQKSTKESKSKKDKKKKKPGAEKKESTPLLGPPSKFIAVRARMPVRISREAKTQAKELQKTGKLKDANPKRMGKRDKTVDKSKDIGITMEKRGEDLTVFVAHPTTPTSIVAHRQKDQGELTMRKKTKRLAEKLRKKRKRKGGKR